MYGKAAQRSLFFKLLLGLVYLSFFCVQLHLKYVVSFEASTHVVPRCVCPGKEDKQGQHVKQGNVRINIKLNKRYQPETFYTLPSQVAVRPAERVLPAMVSSDLPLPLAVTEPVTELLRGPPSLS